MARSSSKKSADWTLLEDAYGSAEAVPRELARLSSASSRTRASALGRLEARICHQGSVYSASLAAVPLLLERVRSRTQKDKAAIVALLVDVAVGDHGNFLDGALAGARAPRRAGKTIEARCFDAVCAGASAFVALLDDEDASARAAAAFALAWLPDRRRAHAAAIRARARTERDGAALASMLVALGHLGDQRTHRWIAEHLTHRSEVVAAGAAIGLYHLEKNKLGAAPRAVLARASASQKLARTAQPWNGGRLGEHAGVVLARLPARPRGRGSAASERGANAKSALASLRTLGFGQASAVAARLVRELFSGKAPKPWDAMTTEQRALLTTIVKQGLGTWRGDLDVALRSRGLPWLDDLPKLAGVRQGLHRDFRGRGRR